jgi:hypothetical protein
MTTASIAGIKTCSKCGIEKPLNGVRNLPKIKEVMP